MQPFEDEKDSFSFRQSQEGLPVEGKEHADYGSVEGQGKVKDDIKRSSVKFLLLNLPIGLPRY